MYLFLLNTLTLVIIRVLSHSSDAVCVCLNFWILMSPSHTNIHTYNIISINLHVVNSYHVICLYLQLLFSFIFLGLFLFYYYYYYICMVSTQALTLLLLLLLILTTNPFLILYTFGHCWIKLVTHRSKCILTITYLLRYILSLYIFRVNLISACAMTLLC